MKSIGSVLFLQNFNENHEILVFHESIAPEQCFTPSGARIRWRIRPEPADADFQKICIFFEHAYFVFHEIVNRFAHAAGPS